jgi:hypothetical protein
MDICVLAVAVELFYISFRFMDGSRQNRSVGVLTATNILHWLYGWLDDQADGLTSTIRRYVRT